MGVKKEDKDKALLLLSTLLDSNYSLMAALLFGKNTIKIEDAIFAILEDEKLRKPAIGSKGTTYVVSDGHGHSAYCRGCPSGTGT